MYQVGNNVSSQSKQNTNSSMTASSLSTSDKSLISLAVSVEASEPALPCESKTSSSLSIS